MMDFDVDYGARYSKKEGALFGINRTENKIMVLEPIKGEFSVITA